jgi:UDP-N-acetylmuramoyl-L-alanyl-D-glutamate--2,6-diaminopimelate ligase
MNPTVPILTNVSSAVAWLRERGATGLTTDSRQIKKGDAFIAWPGAAVDGRQFISAAIESGAVAALMEPIEPASSLETTPDMAYVRAYAGLKAASGDIASQFYNHPSSDLNIIAFTGTNGKTSSSWWLAQALSALPEPYTQGCAVVGTLGTGLAGKLNNNGLTTPDPVHLQERLKAFANNGTEGGCKAVALEASSIGIAEGRLNGTRIHTAAFTNFTQDHLDYHGSMEAYWQAKAALFDWPDLKAVVINLDDVQGFELLGKAPDVWTYSIDASSHKTAPRIHANNITATAKGLAFDVVEGTELHSLQTALMGRYNISNLLGVIAAMRSLHIPLAWCIKACEAITPVPGRLEIVSQAAEPLVVVDYAHTPDALGKVLVALREVTTARGGKLWCVFGCGGSRDSIKRPLMGATARSYADKIVVTSDNPRNESPSVIISQILLGLGESQDVQVQADRALAIEETIAQAQANDVIVIAGKGHEDYQEIAGVKTAFSDQAHARAALASRGAAA